MLNEGAYFFVLNCQESQDLKTTQCVLFISIMRNKQMMIKILNRQFNTLLNVLNRNDKKHCEM